MLAVMRRNGDLSVSYRGPVPSRPIESICMPEGFATRSLQKARDAGERPHSDVRHPGRKRPLKLLSARRAGRPTPIGEAAPEAVVSPATA
jgi:hypothetical protein